MIGRDPGVLSTVLERLLQVDRIGALDPLRRVADPSGDAPAPRATGAPLPQPASPSASPASSAMAATLVAALPLGGIVTARVVDVPGSNHVVAEVGDLRIALSWPAASGVAPQPGQDLPLRVLAHAPMLLFQRADAPDPPSKSDDHVHWSGDAMRLQAIAAPAATPRSGTGAVRFDVPILAIEAEDEPPLFDPDEARPRDPSAAVARAADRDAPAAAAAPGDAVAAARAARSTPNDGRTIALDDVIVARGTTLVGGIEVPGSPLVADAVTPPAPPFGPLILQGPAWDGQPMELVVRRERDDAEFDNPVLDHWCGEVTIDLPHLGRVAGHLSFSMQGLRVRIEGDDEHSVMTMSAASAELAAALAASDLRVAGLTVGARWADATRTDWGGGLESGFGGPHG